MAELDSAAELRDCMQVARVVAGQVALVAELSAQMAKRPCLNRPCVPALAWNEHLGLRRNASNRREQS